MSGPDKVRAALEAAGVPAVFHDLPYCGPDQPQQYSRRWNPMTLLAGVRFQTTVTVGRSNTAG